MEKDLKETAEKNSSRREFLKYSSLLGSAAIFSSPVIALAVEQGSGAPQQHQGGGGGGRPELPDFEPEMLGKALKVVFKTYANQKPYQHKFNDALTKAWLNAIDFNIGKGTQKEFVEHYIAMMMPMLMRGKVQMASFGKDVALTTMFDGTMCSVQLFEEIEVMPNERRFPCPYKGILEVSKPLKMFEIEWKDVCNNLCIPLYSGFGKVMGVDVTITPGETCTAKI